MAAKPESSAMLFIRSLALGVLLSMAFLYAVHVLGTWTVENYRPDEDTTYTVLLHNRCALFGHVHTLRPNTAIPNMNEGINGTKLTGSLFIFPDGHIIAMILIALAIGGSVFAVRRKELKAALQKAQR